MIRLLVLDDPYPFVQDLPDLGDRALQRGFRALVAAEGRFQIISGRWQSFAHFSGKRLVKSRLSTQRLIERWYQQLNGQIVHDTRWDRRAMALLVHSAQKLPLAPLDRWTRQRTGQPFVKTVAPRLLPSVYGRRFVDSVRKADVCVFNAGGLLADHLSDQLPGRLFQLYVAKQLGKPVAVANYSLNLEKPSHRQLAAAILPTLDLHIVREPLAKGQLQELGVAEEAIISSVDTAFAVPPQDPLLPMEGRGECIAVAIRGDRRVDLRAWAELIAAVRARYGLKVHFLPGCRPVDLPVRQGLNRLCPLDDDGRFPDHPEGLAQLGHMRLLITDRYYHGVFAIQTATPVIPVMASTRDIQHLFATFEYPIPALKPLTQALLPTYLDWIDRALSQGNSLSQSLLYRHQQLVTQLTSDYQSFFARLCLLLSSPSP
ncbi:MAG: polysaccharide pyruvyl transferase family protein [Candidatus Competibacterales bacterium]